MRSEIRRAPRLRIAVVLLMVAAVPALFAQNYKNNLGADDPAIRYAERPARDRVAKWLVQRDVANERSGDLDSYLPSLLRQFEIGIDSQMLVFSKTSLQAAHISPDRPRAIYFTDDVVVAHVPGVPTLELAAVDPVVGPIFYTLALDRRGAPSLTRSAKCLSCHQGPNTAGVAGLYVGSVIPGPTGAPLRDGSAIITDHTTPFRDRWGGWYVTAKRGQQRDRANAVALNPARPEELVEESQQNVTTLAGRFALKNYLAPTSDIVALMTFEHQTQMTNLLTRVSWEARMGKRADSIDDLLAYMLFSNEAPLTEPIQGVSTFATSFAQRGPRDHHGRSLRDFDLQTRLFKYPMSYMIYSAAFDALPDHTRAEIYRRLRAILSADERSPIYAHLSASDRRAIREILRDTKADLPAGW